MIGAVLGGLVGLVAGAVFGWWAVRWIDSSDPALAALVGLTVGGVCFVAGLVVGTLVGDPFR